MANNRALLVPEYRMRSGTNRGEESCMLFCNKLTMGGLRLQVLKPTAGTLWAPLCSCWPSGSPVMFSSLQGNWPPRHEPSVGHVWDLLAVVFRWNAQFCRLKLSPTFLVQRRLIRDNIWQGSQSSNWLSPLWRWFSGVTLRHLWLKLFKQCSLWLRILRRCTSCANERPYSVQVCGYVL